jgi:hypothetical protein
LPGTYRLYIPIGNGERGSLRYVQVRANHQTPVVVDSAVEEQLETESYVGLRFNSRAERERFEIPLACAIARAVGASEVVLLSQQRSPSSDMEILGAVYNAQTGHRDWGVILPLTPPPDDDAVARFALSLRTRREISGVRVAPPSAPPELADVQLGQPKLSAPPQSGPWRLERHQKIMLGTLGGAGALLLGIGLGVHFAYGCDKWFGTDPMTPQPTDPRCAGDSAPRAGLALSVLGGGAILTGVTLVLVWRIADLLDKRRR